MFLILVIAFSSLILIGITPLGRAQDGTPENGILFADTVWTQAGSPYYFTGPVAVNHGVTLTIEPGTVINMNNTYLQVNGTLTAVGSSSNMIQFNGGQLLFTPVSVEWNDQRGAGCIAQYANFNLTSISASVAIKLDNDVLSGSVQVNDSSVISNSNISPAVTIGNFCTFINNQVNSSVTAGNSSTITNNNIEAGITAGDGCSILSNTVVDGVVCSGNASVISNNNIKGGQVTGGSITGNTISSVPSTFEDMNGYTLSDFPNVDITGNVVSNNNITNGTIEATQTAANNVIVSGTYIDSFRVFGGWADYTENSPAITTTGSPTISGNTITGGGIYTSAFIFSESTSIVPAIDLTSGSGSATITNNTIFGNSGLSINGNCSLISNNTITGDIDGSVTTISNNIVNGSLNLGNGTLTVSSNNVTASISVSSSSWLVRGNTAQGITATQGNGYILDNYVTGTYNGIGNVSNGTVNGSGIGINILSGGTIERNIIANNTFGIVVSNCTGIVLNNTIIYDGVGVALNVTSSTTTINFNNIQSNGQSVVLEQGTAVNINATYNWWGTTDTNAISQTIYDYKNDFNLGNVTFIPILNSANSQAVPNLNLPSPNPSPTPSPSPSPSSSPSPSPSPTPSPSPSTSPSISSTPTSSPTSSTSPTATATPTSTPAPAVPEFAMPAIVLLLASLLSTSAILKHRKTSHFLLS
ncbi:MAG: hypothetical protein ABSA75_14565 [Candidatus Bathyarchaeia archaeon]